MTQLPEGAVGGADNAVVAAEPTLEERFAAHANGDVTEEDEPQGDLPSEDDAALEAEVTDEDLAEAEIDEADLPPIEPPVSLNAEEKEAFKTWPREAQEAISRRVGELEKGLHSKAQEAKTETAKVEQAARERIAQERNVHLQSLQALLPQIPARPDPRLQITDQVGYANQLANHEWAVAQHQQAQQLVQHIVAQQEADERSAAQQEAKENEAILRDKFPEYFGEKAAELEKTLRSTASFLGYTDDQLAHVNAQDVLAMKAVSELKAKADKFDTLMAKQMERVREAKKLPRISKPGTPQGRGVVQGQRMEADRKAMRAGDEDATVRVFGRHL